MQNLHPLAACHALFPVFSKQTTQRNKVLSFKSYFDLSMFSKCRPSWTKKYFEKARSGKDSKWNGKAKIDASKTDWYDHDFLCWPVGTDLSQTYMFDLGLVTCDMWDIFILGFISQGENGFGWPEFLLASFIFNPSSLPNGALLPKHWVKYFTFFFTKKKKKKL